MSLPRPPQGPAEKAAAAALLRLLGEGYALADEATRDERGPDFVLAGEGRTIVVEVKHSAEASAIASALEQLRSYRDRKPAVLPLLATPFMGPVGKQLCADSGIGWFDLSGNADVKAPGLRLLIEGRPNQFKRKGRPSTAFAPKASRIARWLLMNGDGAWTQKQIAEGARLDKGYVSRVLKRLRGEGLIQLRGEEYHVEDRDLLLTAWQARYDFEKHHVIQGVMPARSGEEATRKIASGLGEGAYAATGLAGAWFLDQFAQFRTATVYLREAPSEALLSELSFTPAEKGANVWLVLPNDEGVFHGESRSVSGVICVHWIQVYLDLAAHPERSQEAAQHLRQSCQEWD